VSQEGIKALGFCTGLLALGIYGLYKGIRAIVRKMFPPTCCECGCGMKKEGQVFVCRNCGGSSAKS
jgi:hypothetical protein